MATVFSSSKLATRQAGANTLEDRRGGAGARSAPAPPALPCLSSNNCNEQRLDNEDCKVNKLTGGHRRTAFTLANEIQVLAKVYGLERLGFLTFTFADQVTDIKEAQRRFHSLTTAVLKDRYERAIGVVERQQSERLHFHLVVVLGADIRTGFDFAAIEKRDYRSANQVLRHEWAFWRKTAPLYRFGRTELLPIKSTAEGIARYVGKYVSKHIEARNLADKGARIVRFIGYTKRVEQDGRDVIVSTRSYSSRLAWNTPNGWLWRRKLAAWAEGQGMQCMEELRELFGSRWAYRFQDEILATEISDCAPTRAAAERASALTLRATIRRIETGKWKDRNTSGRVYNLRE